MKGLIIVDISSILQFSKKTLGFVNVKVFLLLQIVSMSYYFIHGLMWGITEVLKIAIQDIPILASVART